MVHLYSPSIKYPALIGHKRFVGDTKFIIDTRRRTWRESVRDLQFRFCNLDFNRIGNRLAFSCRVADSRNRRIITFLRKRIVDLLIPIFHQRILDPVLLIAPIYFPSIQCRYRIIGIRPKSDRCRSGNIFPISSCHILRIIHYKRRIDMHFDGHHLIGIRSD